MPVYQGIRLRLHTTEPFSSSDFPGLKNVDRLGQLTGAPGAAAELAQDAPGLELGVGAFARAAQPGMSTVGVFLGGGLVPSLVRGADGWRSEYGVNGRAWFPA